MASSRSAAGGPPPEVIPKRSTKAKIVEIAKGLGLEVKNATVVELKADIYFKHMGIPRTEHAIYERLVDVLRTKTELLK
ncbi:hypothetical protein E8E14_007607 [Neopestalotiopsis sp. 37M]|nr:hypothetical protein E8E14_007607 [Neopestalotiopsis sp. 37M]